MSGPLRLAVFEHIGGHAGMDFYDLSLCQALVERGAEVVLFTCDETRVPPGLGFEVELAYRSIYGGPRPLSMARYARGTLRAVSAARARGIRLANLHVFDMGPLEMFDLTCLRLGGLRVAMTVHDASSLARDESPSRLAARGFRMADRLIVHSRCAAAELAARHGLRSGRLSVVPHGNFEGLVERVGRDEARARLGLSRFEEVILFFGTLRPGKGLGVLLAAFKRLLARRPRAGLLIAGRPLVGEAERCRGLIAAGGLETSVVCRLGYVPNEGVGACFGAADIVCLPYRRIYQSGVLLLAMSLGKAVVASDIAGMAEVVADGETGLLFPEGDSKALAERLERLAADDALRARFGRSGQEVARRDHGWPRVAELTEAALRGLS